MARKLNYNESVYRKQRQNVSEAYDFNYHSYAYNYGKTVPVDNVNPSLRTSWKKAVRKKVRKKLVYVFVKDDKPKVSVMAMMTIMIIFAGCLLFSYTSALAESERLAINNVNKSIKRQQDINAAMKADVINNLDLAEVERIATTKLGMTKPKSYQIVYIDVPKQSYLIRNNKPVTEQYDSKYLLTKAIDFILRR